MALGGSTNAVLHLLAIAHEARVDLELEDFNRVAARVPHITDAKPHGRYHMVDIDRVGGVPVVLPGPARGRPPARRLPHRDRPDHGREPRRARPAGPRRGRGAPDEPPDPRRRRHRHPDRDAGPVGLGGEGGRPRRPGFRGHRPGVRRRGGRHGGDRGRVDRPRHRPRHPLRGAQGRPRNAGDAGGRPVPWRGRAGVATAPSSPTAGSRAARTASASATWPPRRSTAGRSRSSPTGTASSSTCAPTGWTWTSTPPSSTGDEPALKPFEPRYTTGVLAKYARLVTGAERGAVTEP